MVSWISSTRKSVRKEPSSPEPHEACDLWGRGIRSNYRAMIKIPSRLARLASTTGKEIPDTDGPHSTLRYISRRTLYVCWVLCIRCRTLDGYCAVGARF